jgi:lysozyme
MLEEEKPSISSKVVEKIKNIVIPNAKPTIINHDAKQIAIKLIKECEGCKLTAYKDSVGIWTIGYGHIQGVKEGMKITQEQAEAYFNSDIMDYLLPVQKEVGQICNANQIAALTSFAFNVGNGITLSKSNELKAKGQKVKIGFLNSTLLKVIKVNPNNFAEIEKQFLSWVKADGKVLKGLVTRRQKEADLYKKA